MNYAILIMYLYILKFRTCSNSGFKFLKSCIAPCIEKDPDCILKVILLTMAKKRKNKTEFTFKVDPFTCYNDLVKLLLHEDDH